MKDHSKELADMEAQLRRQLENMEIVENSQPYDASAGKRLRVTVLLVLAAMMAATAIFLLIGGRT